MINNTAFIIAMTTIVLNIIFTMTIIIITITCVLKSAERKVATEAMLVTKPKRPMAEKRTPSHQNSKAFHACKYNRDVFVKTKYAVEYVKPSHCNTKWDNAYLILISWNRNLIFFWPSGFCRQGCTIQTKFECVMKLFLPLKFHISQFCLHPHCAFIIIFEFAKLL